MKSNILAIALVAIIGTILLAPLAQTASGEQTMGLEMTYGPIGGQGGETYLTFPEMNTTTFPDYWSTNSITILNHGTETWNYWELHMNQMAGDNHSYTMYENYTIQVYNHNGQLDQEIPADENAKARFEHTLLKDKAMYITVRLNPDYAYEMDNYTLPYCLYAYTDTPPDGPATRALTSDTESGTTALSVTSTMSITLEYTGTHPNEVYFTDIVGQGTVPSSNYLKITNSGNVGIDSLSIAVSGYWKDSTSTDTAYAMSGNTGAKRPTAGTFTLLNPSVTWTHTGWLPSTYREYRFQIINVDLPADTYTATASITAVNGALSDTQTADFQYGPYVGAFDVSMTYASGTGFDFPSSDPGTTNIETTNEAIITNTASSDYTADTIEFLFQPLSDGAGHTITFASNADLILTDTGGTKFIIPLGAYTSSGITYGRALIQLDDADNTKPDDLAPGEALHFGLKLYTIPADTAPGSYSSTFTITCSANPLVRLPGEIIWPRPLPDPNPPPEYFTIHPRIHNSTGGENLTTGDQTSFNLSTRYGYDSYTNFLWKIYDQNGTLVKEILWNNVSMIHTLASYGNTATTRESAPIYIFDKPGNYTATITPIDYNGNQIPQYGTSTSFNVTGPDLTNTNIMDQESTSSSILLGICGLGIILSVIVGVIYLVTRKPPAQ